MSLSRELVTKVVVIKTARHESCRYQKGSSRKVSFSREFTEKCRDDIWMTLDNDFRAVELSSAL